MVRGLLVLLACQLIGEVTAQGLDLPVPGPVLGLALLVLLLWVRARRRRERALEAEVERVADGLLGGLALLFVPAGVGVIQYGALLQAHAVLLAVTLIVSTLLTMLATVGTFLLVKRWTGAAS